MPPKQRSIITPEHFTVAPEMLGLPLASPSRRAVAMAIDGFLILLLLRTGGVLLGVVAATLLFRASGPDPRSGLVRRSVRAALRIAGALILFYVIIKGWGALRERARRPEPAAPTEIAATTNTLGVDLSPRDLLALARPMLALRKAEDPAAVERAATSVLDVLKSSGATRSDLYGTRLGLIELMGENADSSDVAAVDGALRAVAGPAPSNAPLAPVVRAYLSAVESNDSAAVAAYRDTIRSAVAGEQIVGLDRRVQRQRARADSLDRALEEARKTHGLRTFLAGAADDLGVGFGWSAVYFTAFLALWRGQTPGKRAARVRVLRLDGKPLGWWMSFERFGGYAASFSVGLIGFFQILWDRNRQGLHDKACETVVVVDSAQARSRA